MPKCRDWTAIYELLGQCVIHFACHSRITTEQRKQLFRLLGPTEAGLRKVDWCIGQLEGYQQCGLGKDISSLLELSAWRALHTEAKRRVEKAWEKANV